MANPWPKTLWRTTGLLLGALALGALWHVPSLGLALGALGCLVWHLYHLHRLESYLRHGQEGSLPSSVPMSSVWSGLYWNYARLKRRNRKHKRKRTRLLRQFREAAAALPDAVVVLGAHDEVRWLNPGARERLGLGDRDMGQPIAGLVRHPDFIAFLNRKNYTGSVEFPSPVDPGLVLNLRMTPYGKHQHLLLATDVSRLRRLERTRQDFVANVSHELRTPLTVVDGYLAMMLDDDDPALEPWQPPLSQMRQQSQRMLNIIEELLLLSRLETEGERPVPQPVAVPNLIDEIIDDAKVLSGDQDHVISAEVEAPLGLMGHEGELRSAFSNLIYNAVRHTPARRHITVHWWRDAAGAHFQVEDNGEGIPPEHLPRITERFYRVDRSRHRQRGGTGLGLAIVKHVVARHEGRLRVESAVGVGSTFTCTFPAKRQVSLAAAAPGASPAGVTPP
ncbi:MAG: phosphate regulon sensor histidine kinase PhoR [Candidatus Competibacterales bacterium]